MVFSIGSVISGIMGMRWVSIAITVLKWGSVAAVVGWLGWNVVSNKNLKDELASANTEISILKESYSEIKRRVEINEKELKTLQEKRFLSRREAEELKRMIANLDINDENLTEEEVENIINDMWNTWINELREISDN